ncbi:MAG: Bax inhibitor-1/YccA family protein [Actinomycetota bacterium]
MSDRFPGYTGAMAAPLDERLLFIRKTYAHLAGAIVAFMGLSFLLYAVGAGEMILRVLGGNRIGWLLLLGAFVLAGSLATSMAQGARSLGTQYAGLGLYTLAEAIIFSPMIFIASIMAPGVLPLAAGITLVTFAGLSFYTLITKTDFSFLRTALVVGSIVALGVIVCGALFGFSLGIWFSAAMILLASGMILYSTSKVMHTYQTDQYVAAALELFAAVALLFWYVLRLLMSLQRR